MRRMLQKVRNRYFSFKASKLQNIFSLNHGWGKVKEVSRSYLNAPFIFFSSLFLFEGSVGLVCQKVERYLVLYNKQMKGYRERDVVNNAWNSGESK